MISTVGREATRAHAIVKFSTAQHNQGGLLSGAEENKNGDVGLTADCTHVSRVHPRTGARSCDLALDKVRDGIHHHRPLFLRRDCGLVERKGQRQPGIGRLYTILKRDVVQRSIICVAFDLGRGLPCSKASSLCCRLHAGCELTQARKILLPSTFRTASYIIRDSTVSPSIRKGHFSVEGTYERAGLAQVHRPSTVHVCM